MVSDRPNNDNDDADDDDEDADDDEVNAEHPYILYRIRTQKSGMTEESDVVVFICMWFVIYTILKIGSLAFFSSGYI